MSGQGIKKLRGMLILENSTISGNGLGAIDSYYLSPLYITNSTIAGNSSIRKPQHRRNSSGAEMFKSATVSWLETPRTDCSDCLGTITSGGHNIIGTISDCNFALQPSDKIGVDAKTECISIGRVLCLTLRKPCY